MRHYFHGGIHPADGTDKLLSNQVPIRMYTPKSVEISMKQSPNSVCEAIVKVKDKVSRGDLIGKSVSFGSANIHASISGTVNDIKTIRDDWGRDIEIIVIEADDKEADTKRASNDYEQGLVDISSYTVETIISKMVEGGIIGMGGAGFPTHVKYETEEDIQYVLINAANASLI